MGWRTVNATFAPLRREQLCSNDRTNYERICAESAAGEVKKPLDNNDDDLFSKRVIRAPNGERDQGHWRSFDNFASMFVDRMCHRSGLFAIMICCITYELGDFVE